MSSPLSLTLAKHALSGETAWAVRSVSGSSRPGVNPFPITGIDYTITPS